MPGWMRSELLHFESEQSEVVDTRALCQRQILRSIKFKCPGGGIGIRVRLKIESLTGYGFDSHSGHIKHYF